MVVQASVKTPKSFKCPTPSEKNTCNSQVRKPFFYKDSGDDDHVPLSARLSRMSNLGPCSSKCVDDSVKKRPLANNNSLQIPVKKSKVSVSLYDDNDNGDISISLRIKRSGKSADNSTPLMKKFMEKKHALVEKSIGGGQKKKRVQEQRLHPLKKDIDRCSKEFENKKMKVHNKDRKRREGELKILSQKIAECAKELKNKEKELDAVKNLISGQAKELESERKKLLKVMSLRRTDPLAQMKDFESMKKQFEDRVEELETNEMQFEGQMKEIASKHKQLEIQVKEFESREEGFEGQIKELKSEMQHYENRLKEIAFKEKQLEHQVKEFETKKEELEGQKKELESKEEKFNGQVKVFLSKLKRRVKKLKTKKKKFKERVREFESKEVQHEDRVKEFQTREEVFEGLVKELKSRNRHLESQAEDFKSEKEQSEGLWKDIESKENKFEVQAVELISKENQFEGQVKDFESKPNKFAKHLKDFELREKQYEVLLKSFEEDKESGNQSSPTIDGRHLQFLPNDQMDEIESLGNDIVVELLASSDPSKDVLDIIQNPIIPRCIKGDSGVSIDGSHIVVLQQLMRISPDIKPHVREEALKLALDLKANMSENTENSLAVLGFLLILSIYGLVHSFNEDEVFKLFGFVVHHKIAVDLFETLGFGDKISDLVQNLTGKKQYTEAVRFICAYNLVDKYQIVGLL